MRLETVKEMPRRRSVFGVNPEPGIDERADQPGPHRSLVIGGVAGAQVAEIPRFVIGLARGERAQSNRRYQLGMHRGNDRIPILPIEDRVLERNRENLVRSESGVVTIFTIDDIVEIAACRVPKAAIEGIAGLVRMGCEFVGFRVLVLHVANPPAGIARCTRAR